MDLDNRKKQAYESAISKNWMCREKCLTPHSFSSHATGSCCMCICVHAYKHARAHRICTIEHYCRLSAIAIDIFVMLVYSFITVISALGNFRGELFTIIAHSMSLFLNLRFFITCSKIQGFYNRNKYFCNKYEKKL
jgi:hypothetical protein